MRTIGLLVAALTLAACSAPSAQPPQPPRPPGPTPSPSTGATAGPTAGAGTGEETYVALGDSFTSGPLVPTTAVADGCFRSDHNYPALLADRLGIEDFTDVSCSGADTRDLVRPQDTGRGGSVPPQLDAVGHDATLVTLGIGGNDLGLYGDLVRSCLRARGQDPAGAPCRDAFTRDGRGVGAVTTRIGARVQRSLDRVRATAPEARVVLVGYPRIAPRRGTCPRRLPYATGDVRFGDDVLRALNTAMFDAADRAGAEFLDLYAASRGHDVCAAEPWVNGVRIRQNAAAPFHPLPRGMRAAARELERLLIG